MTLKADDFSGYFALVHGVEPFPWQQRLLRTVLETGWPRTLKLPTASGKTAVLDVAVFALGCQAVLPAAQRTMSRRIVLVVDRRIVVDGAFERAQRICSAVDAPQSPVLKTLREALLAYGGEYPLYAAALRGGMYREERWARTPTQPAILCSTVDQVGSRLLHRGYGLSSRVWPIHAGLLSHDCLVILDEAHCSMPFLETLANVKRYAQHRERALRVGLHTVSMTATPADGDVAFELSAEDRAHPVLQPRLAQAKPLTVRTATKPKAEGIIDGACEAAVAGCRPGRTIMVTVNRVATARAIWHKLDEQTRGRKAKLQADILLLTGRSRSVERDELLKTYQGRIMAGRNREAMAEMPCLVVVATQCVEVGADLDVDELVTEMCPLDSLRQRLGRLNRLGQVSNGEATCTIICPQELAWKGDESKLVGDPVYGQSTERAWHWMKGEGISDGAAAEFGVRCEGAPHGTSTVAPNAPVMFPAYCDLWAQTEPPPVHTPAPSLFLHGAGKEEPEIQIVWRADLEGSQHDLEIWRDTVSLCPPVAGEAISLRISVARKWLGGEKPGKLPADPEVEGLVAAEGAEDDEDANPFIALRWTGDDSELVTTPRQIRPGDTLILAGSSGGCDRFGWAPASTDTVEDVALAARKAARRAPVIRFQTKVFSGIDVPETWSHLAAVSNDSGDDEYDIRSLVEEALRAPWGTQEPSAQVALLQEAARVLERGYVVEPHPSGTGWVVAGKGLWAEDGSDFTNEDDTASRAPRPLSLAQHLEDVRADALEFANHVGLDTNTAQDVALAGHLHDLGKADPRFQGWLWGGDRLKAARSELLAKSAAVGVSKRARDTARKRSGYPLGARHELLSVRLAEAHAEILKNAHDRDLVLHLIASHHGYCRPFAPVVVDARPLKVTMDIAGVSIAAMSDTQLECLDSGVGQRFWSLIQRYGWWGLSYLEACLRLADHRASERRAREGGGE